MFPELVYIIFRSLHSVNYQTPVEKMRKFLSNL